MAYVESYDDIAFWRTLLAEFENEERYFQVMLPSATSLAKGKKMVLMKRRGVCNGDDDKQFHLRTVCHAAVFTAAGAGAVRLVLF